MVVRTPSAAHPGQQPQPADACAGADLDDRLGARQLRKDAQQRADRRGDRTCAAVVGAFPRRRP